MYKEKAASSDGAAPPMESETRLAPADKDIAITIVGEERHAIDPIVAARARRKIDFLLIPTMTVGCKYPFKPRRELSLTNCGRWSCIL